MILRVLYLFIMLAFVAGCSNGRERVDPKILVGTYETSAYKYEDRFMDIRQNSIAFGTGGLNFQSYAITKIIRDSSSGKPEYTMYYKDFSGNDYEISFYFDSKLQVIRLKHQDQIEWKMRSRS